MFTAALVVLDLALFVRLEPPDLRLSGEPLPAGAVARFGVPHPPAPNWHYPSAAAFAEASFRVALGDGKDVRVWAWHPPGAQPPKHLFTGHAAEITRLSLSPDGRAMASADKDGGVRVWDLATGQSLLATKTDAAVEHAHQTSPRLAVSAGGRFVFIPGKSGFVVWDTVAGKASDKFGPGRSFVAAGFSPDGTQLATADAEGKLDLWDTVNGKYLAALPWQPKPPPKDGGGLFGPKLGPGGKPQFPRDGLGLRYVVDPPSPEHDGGVIRVAFTADGKRVLAAGASVVRAWDAKTRDELWMSSHSFYHVTEGNATAWVNDGSKLSGMDVSADGRHVATADVSGTLRLKDAATGKDVWSRARAGGGGALGVAFHPNGKWLVSHAAGNVADLWDVRTGARIATTGGHTAAAWAVAFSADGSYVAGFGEDHYLDAYDVARGRVSNRLFTLVGTGNGFGFTANNRYVVTGPAFGGGQFAAVEFTHGPRAGLAPLKSESWHGSAPALCIDPRAPARIVNAGQYQVIYGEDIPTKKWVGYGDGTAETYVRLNETPYRIALAADAGRLVVGSGSYAKRATVLDLKTGKEPVKLEDDVPAYGVAVTPDGSRIAATTRSEFGYHAAQELRVWDGETGKRKWKLDFGDVRGGPPVFSPNGKRIAVGAGGEVVIVDAESGKELWRAKGHRGPVWGLAFSPNGRRLASCGDDGQTLLWDVAGAGK